MIGRMENKCKLNYHGLATGCLLQKHSYLLHNSVSRKEDIEFPHMIVC